MTPEHAREFAIAAFYARFAAEPDVIVKAIKEVIIAACREQKEADATVCENTMLQLTGIDSLGACASRGWMQRCADAIRGQE